jgi:protoporphyrinogen oxidase
VEEERRASIAVIGAGVTGLVAAYRLLQRGHEVRIFEAGDQPGGLLRTFEVDSARLECFYHHLFTSDGAAIRLFDELGLLKTLKWRTTKMGIFYEDHVYPFTSPWDLMRFRPLLGIRDRVRMGLVALQLRRRQQAGGLDELSASEWMRRYAGRRAATVIWDPLLQAKFGEMAPEVSMAWLWNRLRLRFSSRTMLSRREMLGYQRGSFGVWIDAIVRLIGMLGGTFSTNERVARISRHERVEVETERGERYGFDAVVATVSNQAFLAMAPGLGSEYADRLRDLRYQDALCLVLALDRRFSEYYWLNVADPSAPFVAIVEHTNLAGPENYGGRHVLYIPTYLSAESPMRRLGDEELMALYVPHLKRINPDFDPGWVKKRWLFQATDAQPVFTVGAGSRIPDHRTPVPGLYLANMAQIYPQDRGQNYSIELGERVAVLVQEDLEGAEDEGEGSLGTLPAS